MKRRIALLIVIILLVIAGMAMHVIKDKNMNDLLDTSLETYTNTDYGVSIGYPAGWHVTVNENQIFFSNFPDPIARSREGYSADDLVYYVNIYYLKGAKPYFYAEDRNLWAKRATETKTYILPDNQTATAYILRENSNPGNITGLPSFAAFADNNGIGVGLVSDMGSSSALGRLLPVMPRILSTLRFLAKHL